MKRLHFNITDLILGLIATAFGGAYFLESLKIKQTSDVVDPGTFPAVVGLGLATLGLITIVKAFLSTPSSSPVQTAGDDEEPKVKKSLFILNVGIFFCYLVLFIPVGFLISTSLFLFALTTVYSRKSWIRNAIYSVSFTAVVYFSFKYGLGVFLPPGILG